MILRQLCFAVFFFFRTFPSSLLLLSTSFPNIKRSKDIYRTHLSPLWNVYTCLSPLVYSLPRSTTL